MTPELSRTVALDRMPASVTVEATEAECAALAVRLQIPGVSEVRCRFELRRVGDAVLAKGELSAQVVQTCVVSLEPFAQKVQEAFDIRFVPEGAETNDDDPDAPDELVYAGSTIDLGEAATEQLALALDPYPRSPDAVLVGDDDTRDHSPFAALRRR